MFFYAAYALLTSLIFVFIFPLAWLYVKISGKYKDHLPERLGRIPRAAMTGLKGQPRIWIHAVSLGEVKVAEAVVIALRKRLPECAILLSTTTKHGRELALSLDLKNFSVVYLPLDLVFCVRPALSRVKPQAMVFIETEIWPTWIFEARRKGIGLALANGRISPRSFRSYRRLRFFFQHVLVQFDVLSMIRPEDRERIMAMGAPGDRTVVSGNAKYETIPARVDPNAEQTMRRILDLPPEAHILVAGSTREGEEEKILEAYKRVGQIFPETILIIAPRHLQRASYIGDLVKDQGYACDFRTRIGQESVVRQAKVVILDTFGELFDTYSVASLVFCGASLVPLGGQNPLEPAAWGKPVFYGPSMEDFLDAREALEAAGGGKMVPDAQTLAEELIELLNDPQRLQAMGEKARTAVLEHHKAAESHAAHIEKLLMQTGRQRQ
jgi:3-deoxy-D-manno-octulosonic-acid transferase